MSKLVEPSLENRDAFLSMAEEWRAHGDDRYALALDDFSGYLQRLQRLQHADQLPAGRVPGAHFWIDDAEQIVACVGLRFWLNPSLEVEGGHVGYDVRPSARGRGFGTAALRLVLPEARRRGIERLFLTADADNVPSVRIIEKNGGDLSGETVSANTGKRIRQYWIDLSR
jgi:predicted acetyltransferase